MMKKEWRVKYDPKIHGSLFEGGFGPKSSWRFWRDLKYFDCEDEAIENIKNTIPQRGMIGVIGCAFLYRLIGRRYRFVDHFKWKRRYKYENGEKVSYCTDELESWNDSGEGISCELS